MIKKFNVEKTKKLNQINRFLKLLYKKPTCIECQDFLSIKNILIIDFALMGDMIMDIPFLKTIKLNCPNAKITMVSMPWAEAILDDQKLIDDFIIFDGKNILNSPKTMFENVFKIFSVLKKINEKKYELCFEPKGDLRHILFMHYTNSLRTVSYDYTGGDFLITDCFKPKPKTRHLIDEKLDLLEFAGMKRYSSVEVPRLILNEASKRIVNDFCTSNRIKGKRIIGLHPGASNINKQFQFYPQVVKRMAYELTDNDLFCVFEGPGENKIVDTVCSQLEELKIQYIRVKRKIKEYIAIVSICDFMLCNDSAAGHIAASYGIPCVVIFGPIEPETALPRGNAPIEFVSHKLTCKPCTLPVCPHGTEECIRSISTDEVVQAINKVVARCGKKVAYNDATNSI